MKRTPYRNTLELVSSVLYNCRVYRTKPQIQLYSRINPRMANEIIKICLDNALLRIDNIPSKYFVTTSKGMRYIDLLKTLKEFIRK